MSEEVKTDVTVETQGTETETVETNSEQEGKVFKQEDVNNIVARESKKATEKLLKDLGIEDFDNAKDGLAKFYEWQESQKTEADKQAEQIASVNEENSTLKSQNAQLEAKVTALGLGVESESLDDVIALANTYVNDEVGMTDAINSVLEKYPQFKGEVQVQPSGKAVLPGNPKRNVADSKEDFARALGIRSE